MKDRGDLLHPELSWVKKAVSQIDPGNNTIHAENTKYTYDHLVVASGVELRYDMIPGSMEALMDENCPVGSMYRLDFAHKMSRLRESFAGGKAIFTLPQMPVKCGGAP